MPSRQEMQVTRTGQVETSYDGETVFSLNRRRGDEQSARLYDAWKGGDLTAAQVVEAARRASGFREPDRSDKPVLTGRERRGDYLVEQFFLDGEGDYPIPYLLMTPEDPGPDAILYLHPSGKAAEYDQGGELEKLVQRGYTVLAPDLVGTGEVGPGDWGGKSNFSHAENTGLSYRVWHAAAFIGRSLVGVRAGDVVKLAGVLKSRGASKVLGIARGNMTVVLLHAAAFTSNIDGVALIEPYSSYRDVVAEQLYAPRYIETFVPGALQDYDLPFLVATLAPRPIVLQGVLNGAGDPADSDRIRDEYEIVEAAYQQHNAAGQMSLSAESPDAAFEALLKK
jgi:pimeloyl-ACP methyl ester carboxylesterase